MVTDEDNRQVLQGSDTLEFIGLIRGKFKSNPAPYIGTGAIISDNLILTAAHNVCRINTNKLRKYKEHLQSNLASTLASTYSSTASISSSPSPEEVMKEFKHV